MPCHAKPNSQGLSDVCIFQICLCGGGGRGLTSDTMLSPMIKVCLMSNLSKYVPGGSQAMPCKSNGEGFSSVLAL